MRTAQALTTGWVEGQYPRHREPRAGARGGLHRRRVRLARTGRPPKALFVESMNLIEPPEGQRPGELRLSSWETVVEILSSNDVVPSRISTCGR